MQRLLVLVWIWFAMISLPVSAQTCTPEQQHHFKLKLKNWLKENTDQSVIQIDVAQLVSGCTTQLTGVPPASVAIAARQSALWFETMRIMFENQGSSFALIYKLRLQKKVLISRCDIDVGKALTDECMQLEWMPVKKLTLQTIRREDFAQKTASKRISAGTVLEVADWQHSKAVQAGQKVTVHYQHGAIKVEAPGKAMNAANVGGKIVVLIDGQRQSMTATLGNDGDVYID